MSQACTTEQYVPAGNFEQLRINESFDLPVDNSNHYSLSIDAVPGAVLLLDSHGHIVNANATACDWLNGPLLGERWRDVYQREFAQDLGGGELSTHDQRWLNISTRPLGREPGQVVLLSDVTESRKLQKLIDRNTRLASMGEMIARLSHQIRTPIATAVLYLTQMQSATLDAPTQLKFTNKSLARLQHVEKMIRGMLMFVHGARLEFESIPVSELVDELDRQLAPLIESANATCRVQCTTREVLRANRIGMVTALLNICCNAIENAGASLELSIRASSDESQQVVFEVSDNGSGIPQELRQRVFQPFFTTRSDGTGLGLSVVKSIIEAHRGTIEIREAQSGGAMFAITIPAISHSTSSGAARTPERNPVQLADYQEVV